MKTLHFWPVAWTLAVFSTVVFALDMLFGVLFPNWWVMQKAWQLVLPGFISVNWGAFFLGLVESFIGGFATAVLFVPIWNFFAAREESKTAPKKMLEAAQQH